MASKITARRLEALAFFSDPERVKLVPGAEASIPALVAKYVNADRRRPDPKAGPSTAASIREEWETVKCDDPSCEMPGSSGRTYRDWHEEGLRYGYKRGTSHTHTRPIPGTAVRCPNCDRVIPLASWWRHGCAGRGTA